MSGPPRLDDSGLVGRTLERQTIVTHLDRRAGVSAVVLVGAAGIGKTALWEWARREAVRDGRTVLVSRAGIAEARLPWVGLTDLLADVPTGILDDLPPPQRHALQVVTLQAVGGEPPDERSAGTALWTVLATLAASAPVVIAIDDLPYLDGASAGALRFALRRIEETAPIRLIATARGVPSSPPPTDGLAPDRVSHIDVRPMTVGSLYELIAVRLGVRLVRPVLLRVHETSGGNPLYALELARAIERLEISPTAGVPLPVPTGLTALVEDRIRSLPGDVLEVAAGTAAVWRFADAGVDTDALAAAVAAGVVTVDAGTVRSTHPLLGAAAYAALPADRRRALHARLAARTDDPVEHARHAALAATGPDAQVAHTLDIGAAAALAAGIPDVAADLARLALEHTTDDDRRCSRLDLLADALIRTGDTAAAFEAAQESVKLTPPGSARARRRIRFAEIMTEVYPRDPVVREVEAALADADDDPHVTAEALLTLAAVIDDIETTDAYSTRAVTILEGLDDPDPTILSGALAQAAGAKFRAGRGLDHEAFRRAIDIEREFPARRLSDRADASYAALLKYADDIDTSQAMLLDLLDKARAAGDLSSIAYALAHLPQTALWRGDLVSARGWAEEYLSVSEQGNLGGHIGTAWFGMAWLMAYEGRLDEARPLFASSTVDPLATQFERQRAEGGLGFVEMSAGDAGHAAGHLDRWHTILLELHHREPGYSRAHLDYVSALVTTGRLADARRFLDHTEALAASSGRGSTATVAVTGRALVAAAEGRTDDAQAGIVRSLAWYDGSPLRFDRARTLLIAGRIHRRARAKGRAQEALLEARDQFASFGAAAWLQQAEAELARVNLRPRATAELTVAEHRVAELAAAGLSNRDIANQLFLSVKTVEANLGRIYRKLDIRSRAELGVRLADMAGEP
ncbi:MAG TPA: AAA family ATPase [Micromonosporaceae bacterium]|jgi:DNA-binding CsgD family transcriptional regulator